MFYHFVLRHRKTVTFKMLHSVSKIMLEIEIVVILAIVSFNKFCIVLYCIVKVKFSGNSQKSSVKMISMISMIKTEQQVTGHRQRY